jgi:hypothetical protein
MNILYFIARCFLSIGLACVIACVISIACSLGVSWFVLKIVHVFDLNPGRDNYWVFNVTIVSLIFSWIISFGYFMSIIK